MTDRPHRIAIFGPDSVHTHRWARYVREAGWEVTWIAYGPTERDGVTTIGEVALETGGRFTLVRTMFDLLRGSLRLRRLWNEDPPDLVQTHWFLGPAWLAALAGRHPIVATAWGSDVLQPWPRRRAARFLTRTLGRRLDAVTYSSESLGRGLLEAGLEPRQLHRVLHGVDKSQFRPLVPDPDMKHRLGLTSSDPVILSPRGVGPVYAPDIVLRAFSQVVEGLPCTLLMRVPPGDRKEWEALRATLSPNVAEHIVTFPGVEHALFPQVLACSDVVISVSRSEGASNTVMEAMRCERPVIVSDIPQNREWVRDERFGTIVPVGDVAALAVAIDYVLTNTDEVAHRARHAAQAMRELPDGPEQALRLYEYLLDPRKGLSR